jgi:Icc-related predicted phosphoesterase
LGTRLFYATDVHGSEKCWMKFLNAGKFYEANVTVLGGDMTGKAMIPLLPKEGGYEASLSGGTWKQPADKVGELEKMIRNRGYYPYRTTHEEVGELRANPQKMDALFLRLMTEEMGKWMQIADEKLKNSNIKCFVCPGNDDVPEIDGVIEQSKTVVNASNKVVSVDPNHEMISLGWTNPSPWKSFKECSEEELLGKIENLVSQLKDVKSSIFNLHAPPYGTGIDEAPAIDQTLKQESRFSTPVGSTAVFDSIKKYGPLLGLHGHIHEAKGFTKIGRTLCINPGSTYERGTLLGVLVELGNTTVDNYSPVVG